MSVWYMKNKKDLTPLEVKFNWLVRLKISLPLEELHLELTKAILKYALVPNGLNTSLELYTKADWEKFIEWAQHQDQTSWQFLTCIHSYVLYFYIVTMYVYSQWQCWINVASYMLLVQCVFCKYGFTVAMVIDL